MNETELSRLRKAFDSLNASTEKLMASYENLKEEAAGTRLEMEENREFLRDILNCLNCAIVVVDTNGAIRLANPAAKRLGVADAGFLSEWTEKIPNAQSGKAVTFNAPGRDGKSLSVSVSSLKRKDLGEAGRIFVIEDETELVRLRKQAGRAERLAAIDEVAAGMAHEIRNPLGGMEIFTSLLRRELEGDEEKLRMLRHVSSGIAAIENVVSNVLMFTKSPKPARKEFDIKILIEEVLEFASYVFEQSGIEARADLPGAPVFIYGDRELIRQALLNMIRNSIQAMSEGGVFELSLKTVGGPSSDEAVEIFISDSGPGVPEDIREKVFDPFFTTKETGAGLGLAIVSQIVQTHSGYIDLIDTQSGGASFIISMPAREE